MRSSILSLVLFGACAPVPPEAARKAWLVDRLVEDNTIWLARDPELVAGKFSVMAADPYDYLRGTAAVWLADLARPDVTRDPTAFLTVPEAGAILVVGDPHIENLGTCLAGPEPDPADADPGAPLSIEWVDLDGVAFGPWTVDTRRAALALALAVDRQFLCGAAGCADPVVTAFAEAYGQEILDPSWSPLAETAQDGAIVAALRQDARAEGVSGEILEDATRSEDGPRELALDDDLDADGDGTLPLTRAEAEQLVRILAQYDAVDGLRVLDAARVFGRGVASRPATRFLVLWDTGSDGPQDDRLLNVRETIDPPEQPLIPGASPATLAPGAARIAEATRLWSDPDVDVLYRGIADGAQVFKATSETGWFRTFDHGDVFGELFSGAATQADAEGLARVVGRALASAHLRGGLPDGTSTEAVLREDLLAGGGVDALVEERVRDARVDLARLLADHALFVAALERLGPTLGAEQILPR